MASSLFRAVARSGSLTVKARGLCSLVNSEVSSHTAKWMQLIHNPRIISPDLKAVIDGLPDISKKSPMELIAEVPTIKVEGRIAACEGDTDPSLGHPIEFICLDLEKPAVCKYCGLRYVQDHHHHH